MTDMTQPDLLLVKEAAALLRVSDRTIYRWVRDGSLPALTIADTVRIRRADIDALITTGGAA